MQDVQEHSSVSKLNNGAIHRSIKLAGKGLFEMFIETYFSQLRKKKSVGSKLPQTLYF